MRKRMGGARPRDKSGRITIELQARNGGGYEATVARNCENAELIEYSNAMIQELIRRSPGVVVRTIQGTNVPGIKARRRGGPIGASAEKKRRIVNGWLEVQGKINQDVFARNHDISVSTLRRWTREMTPKEQ